MSSDLSADSMFKVFIETFADDFGIVDPQQLQTQRREIVPEFVQLDAVVVFPDDFDYNTLNDRTFPFLMSEDQFVGSIATYLVVLNHLPTHPKNASLLLLAKGQKQAQYCRWLLEEDTGMTLQRKELLIYYLFKYNLIDNQEVKKEMRYKLLLSGDDYEWFLDLFDDGTEEHQARFLKQTFKKMLDADTPLQVAQKVLQADSPVELAQKAMQADSPVELALKAIQSEEQLNEFLSLIQLRSQKTLGTSTQEAAASA